MEDLIQVAGPPEVRTTRGSWRALSIFAAIALVLGGVAFAHGADVTAHKAKVVTNLDNLPAHVDGVGGAIGRTLGFGAAVQPQIDVAALIRSIVCPILTALANGPFGGLIGGIIASLRAAFGCGSG